MSRQGSDAANSGSDSDTDRPREVARAARRLRAGVPIAVLAGLYLLDASAPASPVRLPGQDRQVVRTVLPQGWAFFTRDPRSIDPVPYEKQGGRWVRLGPSNVLDRPALGLDRSGRVVGIEVAQLLYDVRDTPAEECASASTQRCLDETTPVEVTAPHAGFSLCGTIGVVFEAPTPWSYARDDIPYTPPREMRVLEVTCPGH